MLADVALEMAHAKLLIALLLFRCAGSSGYTRALCAAAAASAAVVHPPS